MRELSACSRSRNSTPLNQHSSWKMSIARLRMWGQNFPPRVLNLQQNRVNYIVSPQKEKSDRWFPIELIDEASSIISVSKMSKRIESLGANWIAADALEPHHNPKHPPVTMCVCANWSDCWLIGCILFAALLRGAPPMWQAHNATSTSLIKMSAIALLSNKPWFPKC